ncbi:MAG TPA: hypothetical protein VJA87_00625 [Candidatus Paceibacterota bacterium]
MPISAKSARIGGAGLIAVLMVAGGYVLPGFQFPETKPVNAELTDDILAEYVAKDTDADGLPDWQEVLYGTNPNVADTDGDGISDGEAVRRGLLTPTSLSSQIPSDPIGEEDIPGEAPAPGSVTERFAQSFLESYLRAGGGQQIDAEAQQALIESLMKGFTDEAAESLHSTYTRVSIRTDAGTNATAYAGRIEQLLETTLPDDPNSNIETLTERFVRENDAAAGARLTTLSSQYAEATAALLATPAPPSLVDAHLRLIRAIDETGRSAKGLGSYKNDPVLTMGALAVLPSALDETIGALTLIAEGVLMEGEPAPGAPGYLTVKTVREIQSP